MGFQVAPLFTVFQTPPDAAPTYIVDVLFGTTAIAVIRPLMLAGPIDRAGRESSRLSSRDLGCSARLIRAVRTRTPNAVRTCIQPDKLGFMEVRVKVLPALVASVTAWLAKVN